MRPPLCIGRKKLTFPCCINVVINSAYVNFCSPTIFGNLFTYVIDRLPKKSFWLKYLLFTAATRTDSSNVSNALKHSVLTKLTIKKKRQN